MPTKGSSNHAMRNLAPSVFRQRLMIEGTYRIAVGPETIPRYLGDLSEACGMTTIMEPLTDRSETGRWAGWIHWEASGAQVHVWVFPQPFFTADIYTCKPFDAIKVVAFTAKAFDAEEYVARSF